jgi:hypothetical protein
MCVNAMNSAEVTRKANTISPSAIAALQAQNCSGGGKAVDQLEQPRQLIHQHRLADVRRAGDRHHEAVAQTFTFALCRQGLLRFRLKTTALFDRSTPRARS